MERINVKLKEDEVRFLKELVRKGTHSARKITRTNILLLANKGEKSMKIAEVLNVNRSTVIAIKKRYVREGLNSALEEKPRPGQTPTYTEKDDAEVVALACTTPPEGRKKWTLELMAGSLRKKKGFKKIAKETIRLILKKTRPNPG